MFLLQLLQKLFRCQRFVEQCDLAFYRGEIAGREHLQLTYAEALRERYVWHEFGDLHLIL